MYSVRKTRSLSICLIMVLSAVGPLATADHDSHVAMNSSLFISGDEYEMEEVPFWGELDSCTEYSDEDGDEGWFECESDSDGDGENDQYWWFEDCDDSSGEWVCTLTEVQPLIEEGNHSLVFEVYDLEADTNFTVNTHVHTWSIGNNWNLHWGGNIHSDMLGGISSSDLYLVVENSTCSGYAHISVSYAENGTNWSAGESLGSNSFYFDGPCEVDSHLNLEYDGVLWEETPHEYMGDGIMDCDEYGVHWFCSMDYNQDGEADDMRQFEDCDNSSGDWECVEHYEIPSIEEGSHTMVIEASGLDPNESYVMEVETVVCGQWNCDEEYMDSIPFNGSTESETFYMETDNYTCRVEVRVMLGSGAYWDNTSGEYMGWNEEVEFRGFFFDGPCEMPPNPFTLSMDGVVHEEIIHYHVYDNCEEEDGYFRCQQDDWHESEWDHYEECEEDSSSGTWSCEAWREDPFMPAGNHSMQLDIENLEPGYSYMLGVDWNHWMYYDNEHDSDVLFFNATGSSWTETAFFESTNQTCGVNFHFGLHVVNWSNDSTFDYNGPVYYSNMGYRGPCDQPPSPFTLTYDGVEWEEDWHYEEYDICEQDEEGNFHCGQDDWDENGDGEPDHWDYHEECEEDSSTGTWSCEAWYDLPHLEAGNHTMEVSIEDLEVGNNYTLQIHVQDYTQQGSEHDEYHQDFEATAETMVAETFYVETDNYTCQVGVLLSLEEIVTGGQGNDTWLDYHPIFSEWLHFDGPCEQPPSPFTLYADGVEHEWITHWDEYDNCEEEDGHFRCWQDDWDENGDGEPDGFDWRQECEELSDGSWQCVAWQEEPPIEEGNHTMELTVEDLEVGKNYSVQISVDVYENMMGSDLDWMQFEFQATAETMSETFYMETNNYTCNVEIHVDLNEVDEWGHHDHTFGEYFGYKGPCEQPPSPFTLTYDGVEWEEDWAYDEYDNCEEEDGQFRCWWDYWDEDGDGEPENWDYHEECEEESSTGTWFCQTWSMPPHIDAGDHTMELSVEDLEVGKTYNVTIGYGTFWNGWSNYEEGVVWLEFEATAETMSETFYITTDNFTCYLGMGIDLHEVQVEGNETWHNHIFGEGFAFYGPCEEPPSPFTLYADGVEYEWVTHWFEYDNCEEEDGGFHCWYDDWDYDGDGEPDGGYDWREDCEELSDGSWQCVAWQEEPPIEEGNHTMELTVEDLEVGKNYSVQIEVYVCENMMGCEGDWMQFEFQATAETMSETFYMETNNYTCSVEIHVQLFEIDEWGHHDHTFGDFFGYNGPCEQPPSPFTLYADGVEWERNWHYDEYDNCEEEDGEFRCWQDYWDEGEYSTYGGEFACEEDSSTGTWFCQNWWSDPEIGEGNHTMELSVEDLEIGTNYSVEIYWQVCENMMGCEDDGMQFDFVEATAETMSETFYLETNNYSCEVDIHISLYEVIGGGEEGDEHWFDRIFSENFRYRGPCETPPSPLTLTYDGIEYSSSNMMLEFDYCVEDYGDWNCWYEEWDQDGDGYPEYSQHMMDCEEDDPSSSDSSWVCESYWSERAELDEGDHSMDLSVEDLEIGTNYSVEIYWQVCSSDDCDGDSLEFSWEATGETANVGTFDIETDSNTCHVGMSVSLMQVIDHGDWQEGNHIWHESFNFAGPCEEGDSLIVLEYDDGSGAIEWDFIEVENSYDECWPAGYDSWVCIDDDFDFIGENHCEEPEGSGDWTCSHERTPDAESGTYDMTWVIGDDLEEGEGYAVQWELCYNSIMDYYCDDWTSEEFTGTASGTHEIGDWDMVIENTTCSVDIYIEMGVTYDQNEDGEADEVDWFYGFWAGFRGPCLYEWPVDLGLEVDDGGWQEIEGIDMNEMMETFEDDEPSDEEVLVWVMSNIGYELSEGNWSMSWTMDGLEAGEFYEVRWWMEVEEGSESTFICGNGEEIPFDWVNDGDQDCDDGADEQQYDEAGEPINWFDCYDGSQIWIDQVNDGTADCPNGEDEAGSGESEGQVEFEATSETDSIEWYLEVPEFCIAWIEASLQGEDGQVGMFTAYLLGDHASQDDNGDGVPDCLEALVDEDGDGDSSGEIGWELEDFYVGQDFSLELVDVDAENGTAMVFVAQHSTLDDEFRMKVDYDFFNGDGVLNETEAAQFEEILRAGFGVDSGDCEDEAPPFALNGVDYWCAVTNVWIENLANNTDGLSAVITWGWDMHYNVSEDDAGQITLSFPGDSSGTFEFNGTMCGGAAPESGYVPVTWSYDNTTVADLCVEITAGDHFAAIEVVFGHPDTDGDGYNDFDDRFPDDPEEWEDSDDDGVGDNSDDFPDDANETSDVDGDGVGDNSDAFPWDPTESADSDGDGWGDNSDAFPTDPTEWVDTDEDGIGDNADTDADGDGTSDSDEDSDGDGVNDDEDDFPFDANETTDTDGDGVGDNGDDFPNDANETTDTDGDGIGDNSDEDADGDGTPNDLDDFPLSDSESADSDGDGVGDNADAFPNDMSEWIDTDGDGTGNNADTDDDDDGTPDASDAFPLDDTEDTDTDMDGVGDNADAFDNDAGEWVDTDGDGVGDNSDAFPANPNERADSDGDGTGDIADAFPADPNEIMDSDGDGVGNNADAFPYDDTEQKDTDGDGVGDNADDDADGDGVPDDGPVPEPDDADDGGILPGFSAATGLVSMLGAAILIAGRRKD